MLRISVLGSLTLSLDEQPLSPPVGRPARALLGWLALHPGVHSRATVAARLWPDVLDESARGSLRVALVDLRRALGPTVDRALLATREHIGLIESNELEVDAQRFTRLLDQELTEDALAVWRGELLDGLEAGDWVVALRDEYRDLRSRAFAAIADAAEARGDFERALRWTRERVTLEPLSEEANRELMRRLTDLGDRAAALVVYEKLSERLRSELRIAPSTVTRRLADAVRDTDRIGVALQTRGPRDQHSGAMLAAESAGTSFVGRDRELARLVAWAREGKPLITVTGEPGAGKTRLMSEVARTEGVAVLFGRCQEDPLVAYEPFVQALREYVDRVGAASVAPLAGVELARLLPELRVSEPMRPADEIAAAARLRLFEGVRSVLESAAAERGLLLVLDDLHWADRSTLLLLSHIARVATRAPVSVIGAYRPSELGGEHPLPKVLARLEREHLVKRVELGGLDRTATGSIVTELLEMPPDDSLVEHVHSQTGGNPFFIEELTRHRRETGALTEHDGRLALSATATRPVVPAGVRSVVRDRVERLGEHATAALELAAVAGPDFTLKLLERASEAGSARLLDGLEAADAARLIHPLSRPGQWTFTHALVRAALYEQLPDLRCARLHSRIADALDAGGGAEPAELARHAFAARGIDGSQRAVRTSRAAAEETLAALAYEDAAAHYQRAIQALEETQTHPDSDHCELLLALGSAQARAADPMAGDTFTAAQALARVLGDPERIARASLGLCGVGVTIVGVDEQRALTLEQALDSLGEGSPALRARLLARLAIELYYAPGRARSSPLATDAVHVARQANDTEALLSALNAQHVALWTPDGLAGRLTVAEEMIALAHEHGRAEHELQGRNWLCADLWEAGEIGRFEHEASGHARLAAELRLPTYRWYEPLWQAALAALHADWTQAEQHLTHAEQLGTHAGDRNAPLFAWGLRLVMRLARHEFTDDDLELTEEHIRKSPASSAWRCLRCWFAAQRGNTEQANADLDWLAEDRFVRLPRDANWLPALFELSEATCLLGDHTRAQQIYELLTPYHDRHISAMRGTVSWGSAACVLARLAHITGKFDQSAEHYETAIVIEQRWRARAWLVRTRARYAELLAARAKAGDLERATDLAREATAQARALDISPEAIPDTVRQLVNRR